MLQVIIQEHDKAIFARERYNMISSNLANPEFGVEQLASAMHMSRTNFHMKIRSTITVTANEYIRNYRLRKAAQLLAEGGMNIETVCYEVGFNTPSYFTKCFKELYGILPNEYLKKSK